MLLVGVILKTCIAVSLHQFFTSVMSTFNEALKVKAIALILFLRLSKKKSIRFKEDFRDEAVGKYQDHCEL